MSLQRSNLPQLGAFFILTFAMGWPAWIPLLASPHSPSWSAFIFLFSPAIAALLIAGATEKWTGIKDVLKHYLLWRFPVRWYLLALFLVPAIFLAAILIIFGGSVGPLLTNNSPFFVAASFLFLMFITSGEEIGWRGFALPRIQNVIRNPWIASIVLGVIWGAWHLPQYLAPGQPNIPLLPFMAFITGLSTVYTILFNHTQGSLLLAVALHASTDIVPRIVQTGALPSEVWWLISGLIWVSGAILYMIAKVTRYDPTGASYHADQA